jgi:hypothetical protein
MNVFRIMRLLGFAAFLAGCAGTTPLPLAQGDISKSMAQTEPTPSVEVRPKAKSQAAKPSSPKPTLVSPSTASDKSATTPNIDSPEWKKEQAENERKERHLKQVIEGICRGC